MQIILPIIIVAVIGIILGVGLSLACVLMHVPSNKKIRDVRATLPGANCGACGYSGCDGYAEAVAKGEAAPNKCTPGGETTAKALSELLGVEVDTVPKTAVVACDGSCEHVHNEHLYSGINSCKAASMMYGGPSSCKFGCVGIGDCVKVCPYNCITVENGVAVIDRCKCVGCGMCASVCPKGIIKLHNADYNYTVKCSNTEKGAVAKKNCSAACIGCTKCEKVCEFDAVKVNNFLAVIDDEKCTGCGKCAEACPSKCIKD